MYIKVEKKQKVSISHLSNVLFYLVSLLCPLINSIRSHMQWFPFLFDIKFPMPHGMSNEARPENHYSTLEFKICNAFLLFYLPLFHPFIAFPSFFQQIFILHLLYVKYNSDNRTVSKRVTNSLLSYSSFRWEVRIK